MYIRRHTTHTLLSPPTSSYSGRIQLPFQENLLIEEDRAHGNNSVREK